MTTLHISQLFNVKQWQWQPCFIANPFLLPLRGISWLC